MNRASDKLLQVGFKVSILYSRWVFPPVRNLVAILDDFLVAKGIRFLDDAELINVIDGIFHDELHLRIGDSGITGFPGARGTSFSAMDAFDRAVAKSKSNNCLCFSRQFWINLGALHRKVNREEAGQFLH